MILLTTATQTPSSLSSINPLTMLILANASIINHIWTNQLDDIFNGVFLLDITDLPLPNIYHCPNQLSSEANSFRDHSGQKLAKLNIEVEHYLNNHVQINRDVSANTNNFCNNIFVIYSKCCQIKDKEISFTRLR